MCNISFKFQYSWRKNVISQRRIRHLRVTYFPRCLKFGYISIFVSSTCSRKHTNRILLRHFVLFPGPISLEVIKRTDVHIGFEYRCQLDPPDFNKVFAFRDPNGTIGVCSSVIQGMCESAIGATITLNITTTTAEFRIRIPHSYFKAHPTLRGNWSCEHGTDIAWVYHASNNTGV